MNDPDHIINWQRLDERITTSGRLKPEDVDALADLGVAHVINLALVDSPGALAQEDELFAARGVSYTHIPVPFDAPNEDHYKAFCAAFESSARPLHVHCIANWRVSAFFYRYHREHGMAEDAARGLMRQQWEPEKLDRDDGRTWARFIAAR